MGNSVRNGELRFSEFFEALTADLDGATACDDVSAFAIQRLRERCRKRAAVDRPELRQEALKKFLATNDAVKSFVPALDSDILSNAREFILHALWKASDCLGADAPQTDLHVPALAELWRFGPGSSNGVSGTHTAEKLYQRMSCTYGSADLVKYIRRMHPYIRVYDDLNNGGIVSVPGSKLSFVPKNEDTVRTIASEPSGNMALQLAAASYLELALKLIGINLSTQPAKNRKLCASGIEFGLCTIDLSQASDRISIDLVRQLFPRRWFELLTAIRSPCATLPDGSEVELWMISTMGNGTTFPLMTLILASILYGVRCRARSAPTLRIDWSRSAIFGDDIIIPSDEYEPFVDAITSAGFIINHDKSYRSGFFRESCGFDSFMGCEVTPFYVKNLSTTPAIYVAINQVLSWSAKFKVRLDRSLRILIGWLPKGKPFLVPEWEDPSSGILTCSGPRDYHLLQVVNRRCRLRDDFFLTSLASGGYLAAGSSHAFYVPRDNRPRYRVRRRRIPKGFTTGWDPLLRSQADSTWIGLVTLSL